MKSGEGFVKKKINALQGLRGLAFLGIFYFHCWHPNQAKLAMWGVSLFFILSGFLTGVGYKEKECVTLRNSLDFAKRRVQKTYMLHIVTMLMCIPVSDAIISLMTEGIKKLPFWSAILITNITLTKSLIPKYYFSFNGVSWFLSTYLVLCIVTPFLCKKMSGFAKKCSKWQMLFVSIATICLGFVYSFVISKVTGNVEYFTYICPLAHVFDYVLAIFAGMWVKENNVSLNRIKAGAFEIVLAVILCILIFCKPQTEWLFRSIIFSLPNLFLVSVLYFEKGVLAKILSSRIFVFLGTYSANCFLLHQVIWRYFDTYLGEPDGFALKAFYLTLLFMITLILAILWEKIQNKKGRQNYGSN